MEKTIPLSIINKYDDYLIYFDKDDIESPDKIDKAYIISDDKYRLGNTVGVYLNDDLQKEDIDLLISKQRKTSFSRNSGIVVADVSDIVKQIAGEIVPNKGILIENLRGLDNIRLRLVYNQNIIIYPECHKVFFERELLLNRYARFAESPWFYTGLSKTITFFAQNLGKSGVTVHLQNSPNARVALDDPQELEVLPGQTVDLVPYKFSKFTRMVAEADKRHIALKIWFQTQLMNH